MPQWRKYWKVIFCTLSPILLSPLLFIEDWESKRFKCLYVIFLTGLGWMLEAMPLPITALLPVALFPPLGIQSTSQVVGNYMRETGMMFFGGISLALGIERSGLHKRIALNMMIFIGISPFRILLGIMVTTFTLSCWILGNTAVTAMMIPIVSGLVDSVEEPGTRKRLRVLYMLAVGYAANIGGTAVMIGSIPNLIFRDLVAAENIGQDGTYTDVNFASWIAFNMPIALINLLIVWLFLGFTHLRRGLEASGPGCGNLTLTTISQGNESGSTSSRTETFEEREDEDEFKNEVKLESVASAKAIGHSLRQKLRELGPMSFQEKAICLFFLLAISLWFTRDPQIFKGWQSLLFPSGSVVVGDSTVAVIVLIAMFIVPKDAKADETLMTWPYLQHHFPWSVLFLVGGGFAISDGAERSGLSAWMGEKLHSLEPLPSPLLLLFVLGILSVFTEVMSNAATVSLLTPILLQLSRRLGLHPLYISFPGVIACQYAFILPTSNPPNAIVFSAGDMRIMDMVKAGLPLNFICLTVLYLMSLSWGQFIFKFDNYSYNFGNSTDRISL